MIVKSKKNNERVWVGKPYKPWWAVCEDCGVKGSETWQRLVDLVKRRTTLLIWCECGAEYSSGTRMTIDDHDFFNYQDFYLEQGEQGGIEPEEQLFCLKCGESLLGRQQKFCSDRCRMQFNRRQ